MQLIVILYPPLGEQYHLGFRGIYHFSIYYYQTEKSNVWNLNSYKIKTFNNKS